MYISNHFVVSVRCITYNHAPFIEQALDGFCSQDTSFPYVCVIVDDSSNDGEQSVILNYIRHNFDECIQSDETNDYRFWLHRHRNNHNCFFAIYFLKYNHLQVKKPKTYVFFEWENGADYIAMCEGDDFWTEPSKLQKQVSFLDSHLEYGMCYSDYNKLINATGKLYKEVFKNNNNLLSQYDSAELFILKAGYVAPPSWMVRRDLWFKARNSYVKTPDGTFFLFSFFLANSRVAFIPEAFVTYRVLEESSSHSNNYLKVYDRKKRLLETKLNLISTFNLSPELESRCIHNYYRANLPQFIIHNKEDEIVKARSVLIPPSFRDRILFCLGRSLLGISFLRVVYKMKRKYVT